MEAFNMQSYVNREELPKRLQDKANWTRIQSQQTVNFEYNCTSKPQMKLLTWPLWLSHCRMMLNCSHLYMIYDSREIVCTLFSSSCSHRWKHSEGGTKLNRVCTMQEQHTYQEDRARSWAAGILWWVVNNNKNNYVTLSKAWTCSIHYRWWYTSQDIVSSLLKFIWLHSCIQKEK